MCQVADQRDATDTQDEDIVRMFSDDALDPELAGAVTAVRVVRRILPAI